MTVFRPLIRYADFKGRARRSEYWGFMLVQGAIYALLVFMALVSLSQLGDGGDGSGALMASALICVLLLALFIPNYAVLARRLHDTGRSAIWLCLMIPSVITPFMNYGTVLAMARAGSGAGDPSPGLAAGVMGMGLIAVVASICQLIIFVLTLMPGTAGPNRFGEDPRDPSRRSGGGETGMDDARLDEIFARARNEGVITEAPYKPVFDFGPGPTAPAPTPRPRPPIDWGPTPSNGITPAPTFGRRGA